MRPSRGLESTGALVHQPEASIGRNKRPDAQVKRASAVSTIENDNSTKPLLHIDVNIGNQDKERITFYPGDEPRSLAEEFCKKFDFDDTDGQCSM